VSTSLPDPTSIPPWWDRATKPTNAELAEWLSITSDANRDWWLARIQQNADDAARCFEQGHDSLQERLNGAYAALRDANARIAWLERHYAPSPSPAATPPR
jgi:hypothetical protein